MNRVWHMRAALAGLAYVAIAFVAGVALGTLRVLILIPQLGENLAVLLELPMILAISWVACRQLIARFEVLPALSARLIMGGTAFALLMAAEAGVSVLGFGRTIHEHFAAYLSLPAQLGLAGQVAFALFPEIQRHQGNLHG